MPWWLRNPPHLSGLPSLYSLFFSNKELENIYFSVEALMSHPKFNKHIKWISKQDPHKEIKTKLPKEQKRRGRNG